MVNCDVIKDLIPLVNDDVASEESKKIVNNHCETCSDCRNLLTNKPSYKPKGEKIIKALKKSVLTTQLAVVSVGILLGIWFTGSNNTLYNFYIMPFVGGLAYFTLRKKSLYVPLCIIILTELFQLLKAIPYLKSGIVENLQNLGIMLYGTLFYAVIYALLSVIGIVISFLLSYACTGGTDAKHFSDILKIIYGVMKENGYVATNFGIAGEHETVLTELSNIKPTHIESGNLEEILQQAITGTEYDGITVFTKGQK